MLKSNFFSVHVYVLSLQSPLSLPRGPIRQPLDTLPPTSTDSLYYRGLTTIFIEIFASQWGVDSSYVVTIKIGCIKRPSFSKTIYFYRWKIHTSLPFFITLPFLSSLYSNGLITPPLSLSLSLFTLSISVCNRWHLISMSITTKLNTLWMYDLLWNSMSRRRSSD